MAPVVRRLIADPRFETRICVTAQHREMLDQVLQLFNITPDYDLGVMKQGQNLAEVTSGILTRMGGVFEDFSADLVLVHGDTTTTFVAALAAYYHKIAVGHVEAGLRTGERYSPWPEEGNRRLTAALATYHFSPTEAAAQNLRRENIAHDHIFVTGNTVVDALLWTNQVLEDSPSLQSDISSRFPFLASFTRMILITGHRRENFGDGFERICSAIARLSVHFPDVAFVYPVHLNPNVKAPVERMLTSLANVFLLPPQEYLPFLWLMKRSTIILTDSGGIQEEAPSLGKPVLVMREVTERPEAVTAGTVRLVGTNVEQIVGEVTRLLTDSETYEIMSRAHNPYGDGRAAERIVQTISEQLFVNGQPI
jgi:UDP-N-acetylglucosamine 2-epimerase (non-hydrolysing)